MPSSELPAIPAYLQPFALDLALDPMAAMVVRLLNRHRLWSRRVHPARLGGYGTIATRAPARALGALQRWLTSVCWGLLFAFNPVGARLEATINALILQDPKPLREPVMLLQWGLAHAEELAPVIDLVAAAAIDAERFLNTGGAQKQAYAREVILVFLQDTVGLADAGSLRFQLLSTMIDAALDAVVFLFNKRGHPVFKASYVECSLALSGAPTASC